MPRSGSIQRAPVILIAIAPTMMAATVRPSIQAFAHTSPVYVNFGGERVVSAEDARFWEHGGVDWEAIRTALLHDWGERRLSHGGSTITQQLAKNLYLSPARTPWRKAKEWAIALRLESVLTKRRILELYLNVVEFGPRTYGVEAAARRYFGKPAIALSPTESSTLAAMIPSPRIFDPIHHPKRVERRARRIRRWM